MTLKISGAAAVAACSAVTTLADAAATAGKLLIYNGIEPVDTTEAVSTQVTLVEFVLGDPVFGAATDETDGGTAIANAVTPVSAAATGTATWFRLLDGDDVVVMQGSVSAPLGGGDLTISSAEIITGIEVSVVSLSYVQPK